MAILAFDLGGTKLATAVLDSEGKLLSKEVTHLEGRSGDAVKDLITKRLTAINDAVKITGEKIESVGISVPGIYRTKTGTVWAPNIQGWEDYPLLAEVKKIAGEIPVTIDSDRACYILGEVWKGNAKNCDHAIFIAVGTGIGAGILHDGVVIRGKNDIGGAIGWMALQPPFKEEYISCGCFEETASGEGVAKVARKILPGKKNYSGELKNIPLENISSYDVFRAFKKGDTVAEEVLNVCIEFWGMAAANLVSIFNPEKIIFGGGLFGPATALIPRIKEEAAKWAQPISMKLTEFIPSALGKDAGVYGAGYLALQNIPK